MNIIDLTMPARHGDGRFGQQNDFVQELHNFDEHGHQSSTIRMFAHFGTHVDAPRHFIRGGDTIDQVAPNRLMGRGAVFDLSGIPDGGEIGTCELSAADPGTGVGDIAILRTDWTDKHWGTDGFLAEAPYLSAAGAQWLVEKQVRAVVYDFPEEYLIRTGAYRGEDCVVHHTILGNDIYNIEYVVNLAALQRDFHTLFALPLKLVDLDGAPARVIAFDGVLDEPFEMAPDSLECVEAAK